MTEPYLGDISIFAGKIPPKGWAFCDGSILEIKDNQGLFALIGNIYGGDGRKTFALPDLRGRVPIGMGMRKDIATYTLGEKGGSEKVVLKNSEIPFHYHVARLYATESTGNSENPKDAVLATDMTVGHPYYSSETDPVVEMHSRSISLNPGDEAKAHDNMQPCLALNFIIAVNGIFPSI